VWARYIDSFNASDFESLEQVVAPDYVFEDHRTLGYEPARGIEGGVGMLRSARKASADLRIEPDEVLACDERVIALMVLWHGRGVKAGELEIPMGVVAVVEDDRLKLHELFNPDDRDAIMARYEELAGTHATALGDRPSERLMAEVHRVLNARDYRRLAELVAEDWYFVDHRALGWEEAHGREKCMAIMRSMFDPSPHVHFDLGNPLAADDRLLVITAAVRGRGLKAGDHEVVAGAVYLIENGMWAGVDFYEPDDHQAMIARYAELGGGAGPLGDRPPEQFFKRWLPLSAAKDVEALSGMLAEDFVRVDHRSIGWEPLQGREANVALWRSAYESAECIYQEVEEVLACDPRVIAYRFSWRGIASDVSGGGEFQTSVGQVCVIEDGLWQSCDQYDTDDREAMLARYAELGGRHDAAVADRAPERFYAEYARRWASADAAGLLELIDDNWTLTDRRSLALWDQMRGRDAASKIVESSFAGVQEPAFAIQEVLACDDCVIAARVAWSGIGRGGARFSNEMGAVSVVRDGREVSLEVYDPDDRQAMIARYVELGGGLSKLGDTASERMFAEYSKRYTRRDYDGVLDLMTEDYVQVDHRTLGWNAIGKEQNAAEIRSVWAGTTDIRPEVEEVLAAEDRMLACICTYRGAADASSGGGQFEYPVGFLLVTNGERCARVEWFNPEDREALVARYAELRTDVPEAVRLGAEVIARWNRHDVDGMVELYSEDIEFVDHRALGAEPLRGSVAVREMHRAAFEVIPDSVQEIDEVLAADDRVLAFRVNIRGTSPDAGGDAGESPFGGVDVFENGKCVRVDLYDFDDRASIIARYAELGGGQGPLGELPPERFFAEFCRRWASRNVEQILGLYSNDYLNVDHRQVGWEDIDSPTAVKDFVESALAATTDLRCEVDEVLACNDTVIALRTTWRGHGADTGGEVEFKFGYVALVEDGLLVRQDHYDHDDSEGMLARYKELSAGPAAQTIIRRCELCNSRQQDELRALYAKGYELIDHRPMPWDNVSGGEGVTALVDGMLQVSPDAIVRLDVLDDDGGEVVAYRQTWSGTFGGSGLAEIEIDTVSVVRDGAIVRSELFDPDQGDELRRRVAELRGGRAVAEEVIVRDRRGLPKRDLQGVEAYRELIGADGPGELTESDGDLALFRQGDDPALLIVTRSKEGAIVEAIGTRSPKFAQAWMTALSLGRPAEVIDAFPGAFALSDADGFAAVRAGDGHTERLPDRQAAVDRAEELAGLGAWMSMARNFVQSINSRNWEAFLSMYAPDYVLVDHRLMGWGELQGPEKMIEVLRGTIELAPSAAIDLIELLDFGLAEGVGAVRQTYTGEWDGGAYEIAWDSIMVIRDGRFTRGEVFGVDQVDAMRARMAELLAGD
jgi:ketosteroid isomerase-like protein